MQAFVIYRFTVMREGKVAERWYLLEDEPDQSPGDRTDVSPDISRDARRVPSPLRCSIQTRDRLVKGLIYAPNA